MNRSSAVADPEVFARRESEVRSYCRWFDGVLVRARGSLVWDSSGKEYVDFVSGAGALNYGHNDPDLRRALQSYLESDGVAHSLDFHTSAKQVFLELLESMVLVPRGMDYRVQFTGPTGANAVEAALKLARKVTGRSHVVAFTNAFHGMSLGALSVTGSRYHREAAGLPFMAVDRFPFDGYLPGLDSAELLDRMLDDPSSGVGPPAAIIVEAVQGEGGLNVASIDWMQQIAEVARRCGSLLILDEIQTGCGRLGSFFGFESLGVEPDIVVLSKSLSGIGQPLALLLLSPSLDVWQPGEHNGTFRGNAYAFVTAAAALRKFWSTDEFSRQVRVTSEFLAESLTEIAKSNGALEVKGRGMMQGLRCEDPGLAARVQRDCVERGLLIERAGPRDEVLKIMAPLTTEVPLLERGLEMLAEAITSAQA